MAFPYFPTDTITTSRIPNTKPTISITAEELAAMYPHAECDMAALKALTPEQIAAFFETRQLVVCKLDECTKMFRCGGEEDVVAHLATDAHDELRDPYGPYNENQVYCMWRMNDIEVKANYGMGIMTRIEGCGQAVNPSFFAAHILQDHLAEYFQPFDLDMSTRDTSSRAAWEPQPSKECA